MADIRPFKAVTYNTDTAGTIDNLVAPPYDIISPAEQQELLDASPRNVVRLVLPESPDTGSPAWQQQAHALFEAWKRDGVFNPSTRDSIYFYRQTFTLADSTRLTRTAFISLYKLEELGLDGIYPHEQTFPLIIQEQLALLRACSASFSQIFALFEDDDIYHSFVAERVLPAAVSLFSFTDARGLGHDLWELSDPALIDELRRYMRDRRIFIADGHHRYETSLYYRNERRAGVESGGEEPFDFISMAFIGLNDPGLVLLPVHRLLKCDALSPRDIASKLEPFCEMTRVEGTDHASSVREACRLVLADREGAPVFGLVTPENVFLLALRQGWEAAAEHAGEHSREWSELDVTILHEVLLGNYLGLGGSGDTAGLPHQLRYTVDLEEVVASTTATGGETGFLVRSPSLQAAWKIASLGEKMPHKSTYFYPKMPSGLVIYDHETR